jgi:hypothetical protein
MTDTRPAIACDSFTRMRLLWMYRGRIRGGRSPWGETTRRHDGRWGAAAFPRVMAPRPVPTSSYRCAKPKTPFTPAPHATASSHPRPSGYAALIAMTPPAPAVVPPATRALSTARPPLRLDRIPPVVSPQRASCTPTVDDPARGRRSRRVVPPSAPPSLPCSRSNRVSPCLSLRPRALPPRGGGRLAPGRHAVAATQQHPRLGAPRPHPPSILRARRWANAPRDRAD